MTRNELVWFNGEIVEAHETRSGIFDHAIDYGSTVFDGVRVYANEKGKRCFLRLHDHVRRALRGARLSMMNVPFSVEKLVEAHILLAAASPDCNYFRLRIWYGEPTAKRSDGKPYTIGGVDPRKCVLNVAVIGDNWQAYLAPDVFEIGFGAIISPWARPSSNVGNTAAKGPGNYAVSQLAKTAAMRHSFERADGLVVPCSDALMLTPDGFVAEMTGANVFVRHGNVLSTPHLSDSILPGITRDTCIVFVREHGFPYTVEERRITLMEALTADELIAVGSAAQVSPCVFLGGWTIGNGLPGQAFRFLNGRFAAYIMEGAATGRDPYNFLTIF